MAAPGPLIHNFRRCGGRNGTEPRPVGSGTGRVQLGDPRAKQAELVLRCPRGCGFRNGGKACGLRMSGNNGQSADKDGQKNDELGEATHGLFSINDMRGHGKAPRRTAHGRPHSCPLPGSVAKEMFQMSTLRQTSSTEMTVS